jgi:EAL domain-containing protein (putative c-di-GMP-specific phosphodiesterase class I)
MEPARHPSSRGHVLVVDDDTSVVGMVSMALEREGYRVSTAFDGGTAANLLASATFDAVVSDVYLPGFTGIELLRMVRTFDRDLPVILISGNQTLPNARDAVELGALHYLAKPVEVAQLRRAVARACADRRTELFGQEPGARERADADLAAAFTSALRSLWIAFQPIVSARTREVFGYEALMRSREPALPGPQDILAAAEVLGRVHELGQRVRALAALGFADAPPSVLLFVNLHPNDLLDAMLYDPDQPLARLSERVVLEVTERGSLGAIEQLRARISVLRYLGYRLALDDLGAGSAGLTALAELAPEFVKLDISLVRGVQRSSIHRQVITSVTRLCRDLQTTVVAEGIEMVEEREQLMALGCELLQGHLFAYPDALLQPARWP